MASTGASGFAEQASTTIVDAAAAPGTNTTTTGQKHFSSLVLSQERAVRTLNVAIGVVSTVLMAMMIARILFDNRRASKLRVVVRPRRFEFLRSTRNSDVFPLVLGSFIFFQEIILVAVQASRMDKISTTGCRGLSMLLLPTIFMSAYATLVFGIEAVIRAFKGSVSRGKWNTPVCIGVVLALMVLTLVPTVAWRARNKCFGELLWIPLHFRRVFLPILSTLIFAYVLMMGLLIIRLFYDTSFDEEERISASRMVYLLGFAVAQNALIMPFFVVLYVGKFSAKLSSSRVAEFVLYSSGAFVSFILLFLRINSSAAAIQPRTSSSFSRFNPLRFLTFQGPDSFDFKISDPIAVGGEKNNRFDRYAYQYRTEKIGFGMEKGSPGQREKSETWKAPVVQSKQVQGDSPTKKATPSKQPLYTHKRTRSGSYSLFPAKSEQGRESQLPYSLRLPHIPTLPKLPSTVYSPDSSPQKAKAPIDPFASPTKGARLGSVTNVADYYDTLPPQPLFTGRHLRDTSVDSHATVQIGLRLSMAPTNIPMADVSAANRYLAEMPVMAESSTRTSANDPDSHSEITISLDRNTSSSKPHNSPAPSQTQSRATSTAISESKVASSSSHTSSALSTADSSLSAFTIIAPKTYQQPARQRAAQDSPPRTVISGGNPFDIVPSSSQIDLRSPPSRSSSTRTKNSEALREQTSRPRWVDLKNEANVQMRSSEASEAARWI
ncbi:hypothetical protein IWX90DRAFT_266511 [Phyllosticta citrichinensis]|uniref:Uncharacterized protein n=1 Tax=Phyllosticta citrichinensis TaxID=1130410 RepID=A0ABR1XMG2_9PEZI